jgi:hypothetical protein
MVDNEVAEILAEIKQRVISQHGPSVAGTSGIVENSSGAFTKSTPAPTKVFANLPVMARTWDRLPPLVSKRTGSLARLELWVKSVLKRATRWFTWEQVNFNAAAYQTFGELVEALNAWEQQLADTKQKLDAQREELSSLTTQLTHQLEQMDRQHLAIIAQLSARVEGVSQMAKDRHVEQQARLAEFVAETHLGDENVLDEQRVCYKQLALELSEFRVIADRARRELETRVANLETDAG